jgi:hypothetical protein
VVGAHAVHPHTTPTILRKKIEELRIVGAFFSPTARGGLRKSPEVAERYRRLLGALTDSHAFVRLHRARSDHRNGAPAIFREELDAEDIALSG